MNSERRLIVNADDFGLSEGVNAGIIRAHEHGIVTSASLMVDGGAAPAAGRYARKSPGLCVGLHIDLGEWRYGPDGWWVAYERAPLQDADLVSAEIDRQLRRFGELTGREPSHLDSHQHVHHQEPVMSVVRDRALRIGVPLRAHDDRVRYEGGFYGQSHKAEPWPQGISREALCGLLAEMPPGVTELGCHPGIGDDSDSQYLHERGRETRTLCDPLVRQAVGDFGIELVNFALLSAR